jgi:hypothetical protein
MGECRTVSMTAIENSRLFTERQVPVALALLRASIVGFIADRMVCGRERGRAAASQTV